MKQQLMTLLLGAASVFCSCETGNRKNSLLCLAQVFS